MGHRDYIVRTILHGLSGALDGRTYPEVMPPMAASSDAWIAEVASFVRSSFGHAASIVREEDVARVRAQTRGRTALWTAAELDAELPRMLAPDPAWKASASHAAASAAGAFDFTRWSSGAPQEPGMWFEIELPAEALLTDLEFESPPAGGGRGGGPPAATSPLAYRVDVSLDGSDWRAVAEGRGGGRWTSISFAPARARRVRITQTGRAPAAAPWTMERLRLYARPRAPK
jgi:hypothetical protein